MKLKIQWPLVMFSFLAGLGASLFIFAALPTAFGLDPWPNAKEIAIAALAIVVVGGLCSVFHLAQFKNALAVITNIFSMSGISLELLLLGVNFIVMLVYAMVFPAFADAIWLQVLAVVGIVLSVLLAFFCGHGYVMPGRPQWDTRVLPYAYAGSALAAGAFLFVTIQAICGIPADQIFMYAPAYAIAVAACAITCLIYGIHVIRSSVQKSSLLKAITYGGMVVCGIVIPVICAAALFVPTLGAAVVLTIGVIGFVATFIAGLAVRVAMWETSECFLPLFDFSEIGKTM